MCFELPTSNDTRVLIMFRNYCFFEIRQIFSRKKNSPLELMVFGVKWQRVLYDYFNDYFFETEKRRRFVCARLKTVSRKERKIFTSKCYNKEVEVD